MIKTRHPPNDRQVVIGVGVLLVFCFGDGLLRSATPQPVEEKPQQSPHLIPIPTAVSIDKKDAAVPSSEPYAHVSKPCADRIPKFFIYSMQRSGTHYLRDHYNMIASILAQLIKESFSLPVGKELFAHMRPVKSSKVSERELATHENANLTAFIIMHDDVVQQPWLLPRLKSTDYSVVLLRRRDLLAAYLSYEARSQHKTMEKTQWNCRTEECAAKYERLKIQANVGSLKMFLKKRENAIEEQPGKLKQVRPTNLIFFSRSSFWAKKLKTFVALCRRGYRTSLTYEELRNNTSNELCRLARFIGCDCGALSTQTALVSFLKLHDKPKSFYIQNWEDVVKALKDTPYAWMLDEQKKKGDEPQEK
ncbi:hypothetical protein QOT17_011935 [Balamuthia mandrillaris]